MTVPESVERLVESFHANRDALTQASYGETEVRVQFIDPLFEALGWDIRNTRGRSPGDMDVVHEDAVKVGVAHKAPDYGFYAGRERKFFVEAKRPAVNLRDSPEPAFQLRRYAWSAKLPLSVLTDFEEFVIYDARIQPRRNDSSAVARIQHITYDQYPDRWDNIAELFSRDAVYEGSIDRWIDKQASPRGKETVDQAFLTEIERWRERLASSIALHNPELSQRELNYAVQITVDRILFLRMAEDRQTEEYGRLLGLVNGGDIYARLQGLFRQADERYNSGLFHFRPEHGRSDDPDDLTPNLTIDDRTLRDIFTNLYYPNSPYEFSVLPVDVLGQVYEQFLGKVITLSSSRSIKIEEKPEVRKAGGVYYTPIYIVDYIVEHTVGKLLEGKTPRQAEKLRILDPACGSGSFLIGAYQYLLDWYRDRYVEEGTDKHARKLYQAVGGEWKLTTDERKRILRNNIYGVDIDSQAVEVTKLSLLLKLLEGETRQTLNRQLSFVHERVLPDLGDNIKCGNSLIGPDFYNGQQMTLLPAEDQYRINVFDWETEFSEIMKQGGFDAVIGNPPYDVMEKERGASSWPHSALNDYVSVRSEYSAALGGKLNLFRFFIVRAMDLVRKHGRFGMIVPLAILGDISCSRTRRHIMQFGQDVVADCFPQKDNPNRRVFYGAKLSTVILTFERTSNVSPHSAMVKMRIYPWNSFGDVPRESTIRLVDTELLDPKNSPVPLVDSASWQTCLALHQQPSVRRFAEVSSIRVTRGEINQTIYRKYITDASDMAKLLKGVEVGRYRLNKELSQGKREWFDEQSFLESNKPRQAVRLRRISTQRITGVDERLRVVATIIDPPTYFADSTNSVVVDEESPYMLEYVLGILNSWLIQWRFKITSTNNNVGTNELNSLPFRIIDFHDPDEVAMHSQLVLLVKRMMGLYEQVQSVRTSHDKTILQRQVEATDKQIDRLVYELYGLNDDEIAIVEAGT